MDPPTRLLTSSVSKQRPKPMKIKRLPHSTFGGKMLSKKPNLGPKTCPSKGREELL